MPQFPMRTFPPSSSQGTSGQMPQQGPPANSPWGTQSGAGGAPIFGPGSYSSYVGGGSGDQTPPQYGANLVSRYRGQGDQGGQAPNIDPGFYRPPQGFNMPGLNGPMGEGLQAGLNQQFGDPSQSGAPQAPQEQSPMGAAIGKPQAQIAQVRAPQGPNAQQKAFRGAHSQGVMSRYNREFNDPRTSAARKAAIGNKWGFGSTPAIAPTPPPGMMSK